MEYKQGNYYLKLLKNEVRSLKEIIDRMEYDKDFLSETAYNSLLSGMIIKINVIIEQTLADYHSEDFTSFVISVHNLRQIIVHYHDFRNMKDLKKSCVDIISEFNKLYPDEKEFYQRLMDFEDDNEENFVIKANKNIYYDSSIESYVFKTKDEGIIVRKDKVVSIKHLKRGRVIGYIVKTDEPCSYFYKDENGDTLYKEISGQIEYETALNKVTTIWASNTKAHKECIKECIRNLYFTIRESSMDIYIQEANEEEAPLRMQISKLLNQYFNENAIYSQFLKKREFIHVNNIVNDDIKFTDFSHLRERCKNDLLKNINKKDYFFIYKTISMFGELNRLIHENDSLDNKYKEPMVAALLIKWVDQNLINMSDDFVNANSEFKVIYDSLINYRNYYAHNIRSLKNVNAYTLEPFLEVAKGYSAILNSLTIDHIENMDAKREVKFVAIESDIEDFIYCKYGQYLKINPTTFIGNKLFFSSRGASKDKMVGLVPVDRDYPLSWSYYTLKENSLVSRNLKRRRSQKTRIPECSNKEKVKFDVNVDDLLYIYAAYSGVIKDVDIASLESPSSSKLILFAPSKENNYQAHGAALVDVLTNYYKQRYLPLELIKETRLEKEVNEYGKTRFIIVDKEGKEIAKIVDVRKAKNYDVNVDSKDNINLRKTIKEYRG